MTLRSYDNTNHRALTGAVSRTYRGKSIPSDDASGETDNPNRSMGAFLGTFVVLIVFFSILARVSQRRLKARLEAEKRQAEEEEMRQREVITQLFQSNQSVMTVSRESLLTASSTRHQIVGLASDEKQECAQPHQNKFHHSDRRGSGSSHPHSDSSDTGSASCATEEEEVEDDTLCNFQVTTRTEGVGAISVLDHGVSGDQKNDHHSSAPTATRKEKTTQPNEADAAALNATASILFSTSRTTEVSLGDSSTSPSAATPAVNHEARFSSRFRALLFGPRNARNEPSSDDLESASRKDEIEEHMYAGDIESGNRSAVTVGACGHQDEGAPGDEEDDGAHPYYETLLLLPRTRTHERSRVSNCCAICLEIYENGQVVAWSPNEDCSHAYHQDCIVDYILARKSCSEDGEVPCPTCRKCFIVVPPRTRIIGPINKKNNTEDDDNDPQVLVERND